MLEIKRHEQILKNILSGIYTNTVLQASLGFKGGTCLYIFYDLERFSVDLDFNLIAKEFNTDIMTEVIEKNLKLEDKFEKRQTWFWLGSYEKSMRKIKIEISKREYPDKYVNKDFYGLTIPTLDPSFMFAHKLCAITDRKKIQNRDIFDAHFMFKKGFEINEDIIKIRTGKDLKDYFKFLIDYIEKNVHPNSIVEGLGELLSENQKDTVRDTLLRDILFDLKSRA